MMGITRTHKILTMVAISALALGAVGVAEAGKVKRVKTKLAQTKIDPDGASGKVKSKKKACMKGRKVTLRGPEPFDPGAERGAVVAGGKVNIGSFRTNRRGYWAQAPLTPGVYLIAGEYEVKVQGKKVKAQGKRFFCRPARLVTKA
jgi:hypothetical protein